jgi:DNA invertase Pin-like site-specific DNA recombinase
MEKLKLKAVGYRRVSMREQVDGHSLDAQEKNIRDYAASQGWDLIEIYTDAGISAKKDSHRPDLERLMGDAKEQKFDVIVVDKIDRFYRHLAGLLTALDQLRSMGISFASVQERLDFTSPWGKLMLTVLGILAEIYLDNLRQETLKGKHQRAREGLWNGLPPYGYCKGLCSACEDPNGKGFCPDYGSPNKSDGKRLVLHPVDSEVVKLVYAWYMSGKESDASIAEKLNTYEMSFPGGYVVQVRQKGHPGVSNAGPFKKDMIRDMLNRVFYTGKLPYKASKEIGARKTKRSELDEVTLYEGKHPALINEADFQRVQEMRLTLGSNWRAEKPTALIYPLTGILRCGYCGNTMRGVSTAGRRYYRDASRIERSTNCQQETVRAEGVERQIVDILLEILEDWNADQSLETSNTVVQEAEERYGRAKELYLVGQLSRDEFKGETERYEHVQSTLSFSNPNAIIALVNSIKPGLEDWDRTLPIERKKLLRIAVQAAFLRGNVIEAVQLTDSFMPFVTQKSCSSGEGGIRTRG